IVHLLMAHHATPLYSTAAALLLILLPLSAGAAPAPAQIGMPGCDTSCGNLSVPYPFGMGPSRCYHSPGFNLTCDRSSNPPRLLVGDGTLQVSEQINTDFDLLAVVYTDDIKIDSGGHGRLGGGLSDDGPYVLSRYKNQLILLGCNVRATLKNGNITMSSCSSLCPNDYEGLSSDSDERLSRPDRSMSCSGIGCCQAPIVVYREVLAGSNEIVPITSYDVELESFGWNRSEAQLWPPRVFIAEEGWLATWSLSHQLSTRGVSMEVPIWLGWEVIDDHQDDTDQLQRSSSPASASECSRDAANSVCKSSNADCRKHQRGGYTCSCKSGYEGNPYITNGCQDIDECKDLEFYKCYGQCTNMDGLFQCQCPHGTHGDHSTPGGCFSLLGGNCITSCGNLSVPYPFGIGPPKCYMPGFNLTCDTNHQPARLMLGTLRVVDFSLRNNTMRVINADRVNNFFIGESIHDIIYEMGYGEVVPYSLSTIDEFILIGCGVQAVLSNTENNRVILSNCSSFCPSNKSGSYNATTAASFGDSEYCYGMGCCQAHISKSRNGMPSDFSIDWIDPNIASDGSFPQAYAFIAEEGWLNKRWLSARLPLAPFTNDPAPQLEVPIVLDWEVLQLQRGISHQPTNVSSSLRQQQYLKCPGICSSKNSICKQMTRGYSCHCSEGYDGNPYLDGCKGGVHK
uniref:EGF-like domain-containing protein n=1 Tax=Aegilops tauschii subsp. strangulata TaxID=200361 RepID=A0A453LNB7_AEGTS